LGHDTCIWSRDPEVAESINNCHENPKYFRGFSLPESCKASTNIEEVVGRSEVIILAIPTPYIADTLGPVAHLLTPNKILVSCSKGILNDTLETVDQILTRIVPPAFASRLAYLSGPSFAAEVAKGLPTLVTVACKDPVVGTEVQQLLSSTRFRVYRTSDVTGVELGGALKNVLAIACGISDGLEMGANARAALITRGMMEITLIAVAKGGNPLTMGGLAGIGDIVLTCTGDLSRNRTVGLRIGRGEKLSQIVESMNAVAEGVLTSRSAYNLAHQLQQDCPIIKGIYRIIHQEEDPLAVIDDVMSRILKEEVDYKSLGNAAAILPGLTEGAAGEGI